MRSRWVVLFLLVVMVSVSGCTYTPGEVPVNATPTAAPVHVNGSGSAQVGGFQAAGMPFTNMNFSGLQNAVYILFIAIFVVILLMGGLQLYLGGGRTEGHGSRGGRRR